MTNADRGESHLNLGLVAQDLGDTAAAEREYKEGIRVSPAFSATYVNLADLYRGRGDEKLVEQTLRAGLEKSPKDAGLRHALGLALVRQKKLEEAACGSWSGAWHLSRAMREICVCVRGGAGFGGSAGGSGGGAEEAHDQEPGDAGGAGGAGVVLPAMRGRLRKPLKYADELVALRPGDEGVVKMREELRGMKK